jgi:amidohydrolase
MIVVVYQNFMQNLQTVLEEYFKDFHRYPELSGKEFKTTERIRKILSAAGIEILDTTLKTGLVARICGNSAANTKKVIALRADIDAIPVTESTKLAFSSENCGVMHACGHDFHLTSLLGAALLLAKREFSGTVKLIFQPSEEETGGAESVIQSGALDDVKEIYGLHCAPDYKSGVVAICKGGTFAASAVFRIKIIGKGGHAALPHQSKDPIVAAAALINSAQSIVSRNIDPLNNIVLGFSHIEAGHSWNVIPDDAFIEGTMRALSFDVLKTAEARLLEICKGTALSYSVKIDFDCNIDSPPTNNDATLTDFVCETAKKSGFTVVPYIPTMMSEDFGEYQKKIPGVFFNFGIGCDSRLHTSTFVADISLLSSTAKLFTEIAIDSLNRDV